ncbi:MAG: hypothetical protein R3F55_10495 [Alphaproteobacteria bacterium]
MFEKAVRNGLGRGRGFAVIAVLTAASLGACVPVGQGFKPGPGFGGNPQPAPAPQQVFVPVPVATPACEQRIASNGGTGFWDIGLGQCWACPSGSQRTVFDVTGADACQFGFPFGEMVAAEYLGGR